jgi:hypothetical protein
MSVYVLPTCPTTCAGTLGDVSFNDCAPEVHYGEIAKLYLAVLADPPDSQPFASQAEFDSAAHWATHISESADTAGAIREFTVIGEQPEPEQTETQISGDRTVYGFKKFTLNLEIDETNETNYNFLLLSECGGKYKAWYETADGIIYGGFAGLEVSLKMNQIIPRERTGVVKIMVKVTWSSKFHPFRQISIVA